MPASSPKSVPAGRSRRRRIFLALYAAIALLLIWPVYPFFARPFPLVFGLPLSLAWVVMALGLMFAALVWLFRSEEGGG